MLVYLWCELLLSRNCHFHNMVQREKMIKSLTSPRNIFLASCQYRKMN